MTRSTSRRHSIALGRFGLTSTTATATGASTLRARLPLLAATAVAAIVCCSAIFALLISKPGPLTSDESLYFAEAQNIANGHGATYTTGEAIVHRPFGFPAMLAAEMKLTGERDAGDAYWLPRFIAIATAVALGAVCWRLFDAPTGVAAGVLALSARYLNTLGNSLYVDTAETLCLLLSVLAVARVMRRPSVACNAAAGAAIAAAFWMKESALLWLPLPVVILAFVPRPIERGDARGMATYVLTAGVPIGAWWLWVAHANGRVFLSSSGDERIAWAIFAAPIVMAAVLFTAAEAMPSAIDSRRVRRIAGTVFVAAWFGFWLRGLEAHSWPGAHNYFATVPQYIWHVGPNVQPFYFVLPAWGWAAWRAWRGSNALRLICIAALLHLAFFVFAANRDLALRDSTPIVYLSFAALAVAMVDAARAVAERLRMKDARAFGVAIVAGAVALVALPQIAVYTSVNAAFDATEVRQDAWDNPLARRTAAWVDANVPAGTPIMSSRLYYSSIYTLDDGRYPVHQLPTLRVQFEGTKLVPMSTQFRWEDDRLAEYGKGQWLYLRRYPDKGYDVGMTQDDLIRDLRTRNIGYVVVSGEDAGFSSLTYLDYFLETPGLRLVHADVVDEMNAAFVFAVDRDALAPRDFPVTISANTEAALHPELGAKYDAASAGLAPAVRVSPESGMPDAARWEIAQWSQAQGAGR